jgi:hypothetical protein
MSSTATLREQTRTFARVIGPCLVIEASLVIIRAPMMGDYATSFFNDPALVWVTGSVLLFGGVAIIAFHQYWRGLSAVLISLLGWYLAVRGIALLALPKLYEAAANAVTSPSLVRLSFAVPLAISLWLTYVGWTVRTVQSEDQ